MTNTINKITRNGVDYVIKDTTYTAGTGISIDSNNVISNTQTSAEWGNITGTLSDQTDLNNALGGKQDSLTLPSSPTQGNLVTWGSDNKTLVDGGAVPTGFNPASAGTTDQVLTKTAGGYDWAAPTGGSTTTTATLTTAGWSSKEQTVSVTGVTASNTIIVSPAPANINDYASCSIYCSAQGSGTLTFKCNTVPSDAITVNVLILS